MKKLIVGIVLALVFLAYSPQVQAKWWIFGKAEDIPEITSIFIGTLDITDIDTDELTLDNSNLDGGNIIIKGFAAKGEAPLAMVKVSLDGGQTWEDVNIRGNTFVYQFAPEENEEYKPRFKVMDTAGKESDVRDLPQFTLIYRAVDVHQIVEEVKQAMVEAYDSEDLSRFMGYISDNFTGDVFALEEAVQSDFDMYNNMNTDVRIQQVSKSGDQVNVEFEFNWTGIETSTGMLDSESGRTSFIFIQEGGTYKVLSMASPIVFGSSYASEIATSFYGGGYEEEEEGEESLAVYRVALSAFTDYIDFATGAVVGTFGDMYFSDSPGLEVVIDEADGIAPVGSGALADFTTAPASGYSFSQPASVGDVYALKRSDNTYAMFVIVSIIGSTLTIDYKYQPDGSRNFP